MEWMFTGVVIVEDDLDDLVLLEYERVDVRAIDFWVGGRSPAAESGEDSRNLGAYVGNVIEESTIFRLIDRKRRIPET